MPTELATLLDDPDLGSVLFTVRRASLHPGAAPITRTVTGILQPGSLSPVDPQPGEDQSDTSLTVFTRFPLSAGTDDGTTVTPADEILYQNRVWRVTAVRDWFSDGFNTATAVLVKDERHA